MGGEHDGSIQIGLWVLTGLLNFMIIEKIFPENEDEDSENVDSAVSISANCYLLVSNNFLHHV